MKLKNKRIDEHYEVGAPFCPNAPPVVEGGFEVSPGRVRCDEPYVLRVTYTVGKRGISRGGGLQIRFPGAQSEDPSGKVYLAATCSNPRVRLAFVHKTYPRVYITTPDTLRPSVNWHAAVVREGELGAGDRVEFTLGTEAQPLVGPAKRRKFADRRVLLRHDLDVDGSGEYVPLANSPTMEILPLPGANLHAFLRSTATPAQRMTPRVAVTDPHGNMVEAPGACEVALGAEWGRSLNAPPSGVFRARLRSTTAGIEVRRKPAQPAATLPAGPAIESPRLPPVKVVGPGEDQLYWGDLHFHSNFSNDVMLQGIENSPEECYLYGREVSGLDFACLTDHYEPALRTWVPMLERGLGMTPAMWEQSKDVADRLNVPGEFVTLIGYEYRTRRGDTNLYFRDRKAAPLLPGQVDSLARVREHLRGTEYFSAPHLHPYSHQYLTFGPWKWGREVIECWQDLGGDAEPVIEVFSRHGRYEFYGNQPHMSPRRGMTEGNSVQAHLLRGHRYGLCAGSDDHWGRPGQDGLIAVYAPELTREAIFDAIRRRRCYGTTNARILVDFRVNGCFMGESCLSEQRTRIRAEVHGTDRLARVEIIRDGRILHAIEPDDADCVVEHEDKMPVLGTCFYYLRVLQADQHMAWSSPVWVTSTQRIEDMHGDLE